MAFFENDFYIRLRDVNKSNKITNEAILGFFEDIGGLHSDSIGYGIKNIKETNLSWILLHWKMKVIERANYGDTVHVKTWSRYSSKIYTYRDFEMYNSDGKLLAIATSKWALINATTGRLEKLEDELISKYKPEEKSVFNELEVQKLKQPSEYDSLYEYTVSRRDIDVNNHMHNLYYLDIAYEVLPIDIYEKFDFSCVEIMYKTGAKLGDKLKCLYTKIDNDYFITIKSLDEKILYTIIKLSTV